MDQNIDNSQFEKEYSEEKFWDKVKKHAKVIGCTLLKNALILYYVLIDKDTPKRTKGLILGALGYLIFPIDVIPDILPGVGFMDDAGVIAAALVAVAMHIRKEHRLQAAQKAHAILTCELTEEEQASLPVE